MREVERVGSRGGNFSDLEDDDDILDSRPPLAMKPQIVSSFRKKTSSLNPETGTESAKSAFGSFVRLSSSPLRPEGGSGRENGGGGGKKLATKLRRHKSFFTPPSLSIFGGGGSSSSYNVSMDNNSGNQHGNQQQQQQSLTPAQKMAAAFRKGHNIRRAESFHVNRSSSSLDVGGSSEHLRRPTELRLLHGDDASELVYPRRNRGKSVDRLAMTRAAAALEDEVEEDRRRVEAHLQRQMSKSKSVEYLKAKLMMARAEGGVAGGGGNNDSRGGKKKPVASKRLPREERGWDDLGRRGGGDRMHSVSPSRPNKANGGGTASSSASSSLNSRSNNEEDENGYDWRQDTPFWRKQGRWARPTPKKKDGAAGPLLEEPWFDHHQPRQPQPHPSPRHHLHPTGMAGGSPYGPPPPLVPFAAFLRQQQQQQQQPVFNGSSVKHYPLNGGAGLILGPGANAAVGPASSPNRGAYFPMEPPPPSGKNIRRTLRKKPNFPAMR